MVVVKLVSAEHMSRGQQSSAPGNCGITHTICRSELARNLRYQTILSQSSSQAGLDSGNLAVVNGHWHAWGGLPGCLNPTCNFTQLLLIPTCQHHVLPNATTGAWDKLSLSIELLLQQAARQTNSLGFL